MSYVKDAIILLRKVICILFSVVVVDNIVLYIQLYFESVIGLNPVDVEVKLKKSMYN